MPDGDSRPHVVQVLGDFGLGGDGRVARDLSTALARRGVRATCVALRGRGGAAPPPGPYEVVTVAADGGRTATVRSALRLRRLLADWRPDLVHVHGPRSLLLLSGALVGVRRRPQVWFTWHDSGLVLGMGRTQDAAMRWAMRRCARVFGSSRDVARRLQPALRPGAPAEVFRNGVSDLGRTSGLEADPPILVWAGRIVPPKDPLALLRAGVRLRDEGLAFRVVLAGRAPANLDWFEGEVREFVRQNRMDGIVEMPGWVGDLTPLWRAGAVAVQTSQSEGLSIALLEAMMAGNSVVATDVGDTSVAVEEGRSGLLVRPCDDGALTDALRRVIVDRDLRSRLGAAARERALAEFSLDAMAEQVVSRMRTDPRASPAWAGVSGVGAGASEVAG